MHRYNYVAQIKIIFIMSNSITNSKLKFQDGAISDFIRQQQINDSFDDDVPPNE